MSGFDIAAIQAVLTEAALADVALNLGIDTELLQAQISTGDLLAALVLPPQNGVDLIEIFGQRVAAQLPPDVRPGEALLLQVTGFRGNQIVVRNLGVIDPENPPATVAVELPQDPPAVPQTAVLTTVPAPPPQAPPRAVFVAASVQNAPPLATTKQSNENAAPRTPPVAMRGVEARIAAARASGADGAAATAAKPPAAPIVPPRIAPPPTAAVSAAARNAVQQVTRSIGELLESMGMPQTPLTRTAAAIAPNAPARLPAVLQRLDRSLPQQSADARISTLRAIVGFVARMHPASEGTLAAQISAYVSHAIQGAEAKLAQMLQAHALAATEPPQPDERGEPTAAQPADDSSDPNAPATAQPRPERAAHDARVEMQPAAAQARAAERSAAIDHDLKSVVLSLLRDPPPQRTPQLTQALNEALITLTGNQINVLGSNAQNPNAIALTLPLYYHEGGKPAQIRIARDGSAGAAKLDADNFHVAFVLDTEHLGTVAIELQTQGRAVAIDVKTQRETAAAHFSQTLGSLRERLEGLRYRVKSAAAAALGPRYAEKQAPPRDAAAGLDLHA